MGKKAARKPLPGTIISKDNKPKLLSVLSALASKKNAIALAIILVAGASIFLIATNIKDKDKSASGACNAKDSSISFEAAVALASGERSKLKEAVDKIQKLPKYEQDPNCLYPVVQNYINQTDAKNARSYFDKLEKVYDSEVGLNESFDKRFVSKDNLKKQVEGIEKFQDSFTNNAKIFE